MAEFKKIKVTIKSETHTHAGEKCKPGDVIEVWPDTAEWLEERGVIEPIEEKKKETKKEKPTPTEG
jgi:hypothetical protein